jgi:hypothetical protein
MTAGSDIENGAASSVTEMSGCSASRITSARRVGSESAAKVRSSVASEKLTIWFSIWVAPAESTPNCLLWIHRPLKRRRDHAAAMETTSLISALLGAQTGMIQLAVAARLANMDTDAGADMSASVANLVDAAQQSASSLANVADTIGTNLDVSA